MNDMQASTEDEMAEKGKWTVMVFMAGDNNLNNMCIDDLREMKMVGSQNGVTIITQIDYSREKAISERYVVSTPDPSLSIDPDTSLRGDLNKRWRGVNTGKADILQKFIEYGVHEHQAEHYMLVLWGHGHALDTEPIPIIKETKETTPRQPAARNKMGWVEPWDNIGRRKPNRSRQSNPSQEAGEDTGGGADICQPFYVICPDDRSDDALDNIELKEVLRLASGWIKEQRPSEGDPRIDVLGMDACLMGMAEMCYELRESVRYMIGSESLTPAASWPYHWILNALIQNSEMSPRELCRVITEYYIAYYSRYETMDVQMAAYDLDKCELLKNAVGELADQLTQKLQTVGGRIRDLILGAHFRTQTYDEEQFYDLYDFCYMLHENCDHPDLKTASQNVMRVIRNDGDDGFVLDSKFHGDDMQFSYGLAVYFPWAEVSSRYQYLDFARDAKWREFLDMYMKETTKKKRAKRKDFKDGFPV